MSTLTPTPKVAVGGITGALVVILVWVASLFGLDVPTEIAAALVVVLSFIASYLTRDRTSPTPLRAVEANAPDGPRHAA